MYHSKDIEQKPRVCVCCDCQTISKISDRGALSSQNKLCLNSTGSKHRAAICRSTKISLNCKEKHHTSLCEKDSNNRMLLTTNSNSVTYPVLTLEQEVNMLHPV